MTVRGDGRPAGLPVEIRDYSGSRILSVGGWVLPVETRARSRNDQFVYDALQFVRVSREWLDLRRREGRTAAAAAREPW
jgi:hypothetical protein